MGVIWTDSSQLTLKLILKVNSFEFITPSPYNTELGILEILQVHCQKPALVDQCVLWS